MTDTKKSDAAAVIYPEIPEDLRERLMPHVERMAVRCVTFEALGDALPPFNDKMTAAMTLGACRSSFAAGYFMAIRAARAAALRAGSDVLAIVTATEVLSGHKSS